MVTIRTLKTNALSLIAAAAGSVLLLTGCSDSTGGDAGTDTPTDAQTTSENDEGTSSSDQCSDLTGEEALEQNSDSIDPAWDDLSDSDERNWDFDAADVSTFDECAALSWIVVPTQAPGEGAPYAIMLFNHGEFVETATPSAYLNEPDVVREADDAVKVTYTWSVGEGETYSEIPAESTFTWNADTQNVEREGQLPPPDFAAQGLAPEQESATDDAEETEDTEATEEES